MQKASKELYHGSLRGENSLSMLQQSFLRQIALRPSVAANKGSYRDSRMNLIAVRSPFSTVTSMKAGMQMRSIPLGAK